MPRLVPGLLLALGMLLAAAPAWARASAPSWRESWSGSTDSAATAALADSVRQDIEILRALRFRHPVTAAIRSAGELRATIEKDLAREGLSENLEHTQVFLRMVGLLPDSVALEETLVDVLLDQVAGYYDPRTKGLYMVNTEGPPLTPAARRLVIAHELAHAHDDQRVSLDSLLHAAPPTEDAQFAAAAVIEGSATELTVSYMRLMLSSGRLTKQDLRAWTRTEKQRGAAFLESPPYFQLLLARYGCGANFLLSGDLPEELQPPGGAEVGDLLPYIWAKMPRSSEQILHPEKYWEESARDEPVAVDDEALQRVFAAAGAQVLETDTVGELLCAALARPAGEPFDPMNAMADGEWTNEAAAGWGGDRFYLLGRAESGGAALPSARPARPRGFWITLWDSPADRDEFMAAYAPLAEARGAIQFLVGERTAVYAYGFPGVGRAAVEGIVTDLKAGAPPLSQDGRPVGW